jgi:capsular polysaccharide biosynthesis protein
MRSALRKAAIKVVPSWVHPHLRTLQFRATSVIGGALRRLPGSSRQFGPPRKLVGTLRDYAGQRGSSRAASYYRLRDSELICRSLPRPTAGEIHFEFFNEIKRISPPVGVAVLENGRVITRTGAVIGPDDALIAEVSDTFFTDDPTAHPIFLAPKLPRITRLEGAVAVLTTFRSDIYYHWLFDTLPRLQLLNDADVHYDRIVVAQGSRFQRESLELLGIEQGCLISDPKLHLEAAKLIVPTLPGTVGNPPLWACAFLRRSFLAHLGEQRGPAQRRIYIARGKGATRRIVNEEGLLRMLEREGFEIVLPETMSFLQQVALFDQAHIVIGAHGSGLSNLVFCRQGTHVIELFSPNYVTVPYWALANQLKLVYCYIMGQGDWHPSRGRGRRVHADISIDLTKVEVALRDIGRARLTAQSGTA